ncbi:MAG TPA: GntR family transcriptional regulator [Thermomonospora sp.]|nr:GntR family transcriptional regulator [Thermomonospora sp.]
MAPPPNLVPYGPDPLHRQVAAYIKTLIVTGVWPPGGRLKAEMRLAEDFNVSRGTLKKALALLVEEGLITQVHGRGTFVAVPPAEAEDDLGTAVEAFTANAAGVETVHLSTFDTAMPDEVSRALESSPGDPVLKITSLRRDQEGPMAVIVRWVRLDVSSSAGADGDRGLPRRVPGQRRLRAVAADEETARLLDVTDGTPVQYLEEVAHDRVSGVAAELCQVWSRSDRITYTFSLEPARQDPAGTAVPATLVIGDGAAAGRPVAP